nr:unnamed protein product [Callosobruchus chinensis]
MASHENMVPVRRAKKLRNTQLVREKQVQCRTVGAIDCTHIGIQSPGLLHVSYTIILRNELMPILCIDHIIPVHRQNKNYVKMHFLYMLVHCLNLFDTITYIFPIRGHSFLPNDQDFSIISKKKAVETAEIPEH